MMIGKKKTKINNMEREIYHAIFHKPTKEEISEKAKDGLEYIGTDKPEGEIGTELEKEPTRPHSVYYFKKVTLE